ncbi:hypothetical protein ABMA27_016998 [Loxostege sticticalis]|uniref:THAP-type domain-containing protein n=1 Tax=Loxostege sticticalis TaxID=481309 RepID=A0ABR3GYP1_LOXSC
MPNCAILSCKNSTKNVGRNNGNVSFHRFPNDPSIKEKWIDATGQKNWFPTKFSTICSIHFNDGSFAETNKNRRLNTDAIPTMDVLKTSIHTINSTTTRVILADDDEDNTNLNFSSIRDFDSFCCTLPQFSEFI